MILLWIYLASLIPAVPGATWLLFRKGDGWTAWLLAAGFGLFWPITVPAFALSLLVDRMSEGRGR